MSSERQKNLPCAPPQNFCEIVNQSLLKYRGPLRSGFSRQQEVTDTLMKPRSQDAAGLAHHRHVAKIGAVFHQQSEVICKEQRENAATK
jgi:hypothetical protein